jgi:hypothetical protein
MTIQDREVMNCLSRRDNKTYICNECGNEEAYIDEGWRMPDQLERDFVAKVGKQRR